MTMWIRFDEEDRFSPSPGFCLESLERKRVCLSDFKGDCNLVVVFSHGVDCSSCMSFLDSFRSRQEAYKKEDTRVLFIFPNSAGDLKGFFREDISFAGRHIELLADPEQKTRAAYAGLMAKSLVSEGDAMQFVLDMYGAPYAAFVNRELDEPSLHEDTLRWLVFIGMQCPE
jgi:peroxiredoxin